MASYVSQYRGIGQVQPSGYTELLASGGQSIAAGISSFGNSIGDAIKRYQEKKELVGIAEGDLLAKLEADPTIKDKMPDEQKRLAEKVLAGNGNYKEVMSLHAYVDTSHKLKQQEQQDRLAKLQEEMYKFTLNQQQQKIADENALSSGLLAGYGAEGKSTERQVSADDYLYGDADANVTDADLLALKRYAVAKRGDPMHLALFREAVANGTATPEQRAEVERYYNVSPNPTVESPASIPTPSVRNKSFEETGIFGAAPSFFRDVSGSFIPRAYLGAAKSVIPFTQENRDLVTAANGWLFGDGGASDPITPQQLNAYRANRDSRISTNPYRPVASRSGKSEATAPQSQPDVPPVVPPQAAQSWTVSPREVTSAPTLTGTVQLPATPEDKFSVAVKHIVDNGHRITPDMVTELRSRLNVADMDVVNRDGLSIVVASGKPVQIFQQKTAADDLKPLTAEESARLENMVAAENDLDALERMTEDKLMGPFIGMIRSLNPYDLDNKTVAAKVNSTVPNLARGVFGEVGVLTKDDVLRYQSMLPTLNNTRDQRAYMIKMLREKLAMTKSNAIISMAKSKRDLGGWLNDLDPQSVVGGGASKSGTVLNFNSRGELE